MITLALVLKLRKVNKAPSKKAKSILDPVPDPEVNPNLPNLLHKRVRGLKRTAFALPNKVIVRQSESVASKITVSVFLWIASVKPYLSIIHLKRCYEEIKSFIAEQESTQSGASYTSAKNGETDDSFDVSALPDLMAKIKEFWRLITMEMKWHCTPIFGWFEFFECFFTIDSNLDLKFKTIDSNPRMFNSIRGCKEHPFETLKSEGNKRKAGCKNCVDKQVYTVVEEGMSIVLHLHQIGLVRAEKTTFKNLVETLKHKKQYSFELLYTDFE